MTGKTYIRRFISIFLFLVSLCCLFGVFFSYFYFKYTSRSYIDSVYQTLAKFAPLNEKVLAELTTPDGVELSRINNLTDKKSYSDSVFPNLQHYDVSLGAVYVMGDTITHNEVTAYYQELLQVQGWKQDGTYRFHRGTTCVSFYYQEYPSSFDGYFRYTLTIWHDLWTQSFSAPAPPFFLLWNFKSRSCPP